MSRTARPRAPGRWLYVRTYLQFRTQAFLSPIPFVFGSTRDQVAVDDTVRFQVDEASVQVSAGVVGTRIDRHRTADPGHTLALVDVTVKAEQRLYLFDDLPDRRAAGRDLVRAAAFHHVPQLFVDLQGGVEAAPVRRYVDVEDRPLRSLQLVAQAPQA